MFVVILQTFGVDGLIRHRVASTLFKGDKMNILVCYDGSQIAKKALEEGIKVGNALGAEVHIFYSIAPRKDSNEVFEFIKDKAVMETDLAKKEVEKACQLVEKTGLVCKTHVLLEEKSPGEDIIDFAKRINAKYIVIGVRTQSRVGKLLFGSTAQYVILNSPCPVMTVRS